MLIRFDPSLRRVLPLRSAHARLVGFVSTSAAAALVVGVLALASACGSSAQSTFGSTTVPPPASSANPSQGGGEDSGEPSTGGGFGGGNIGGLIADGGPLDDGGSYSDGPLVLPANFVPTELGGYALGPAITSAGIDGGGIIQNGDSQSCSLVTGVVRDFLSYELQDGGDPDFEHFSGQGPTLGLVQTALGSDEKPVYAGECDNNSVVNPPCLYGQEMTTAASFNQWYRDTAGVNLPYLVYLEFVPNGGVYTFQSNAYFPLDNAGFGNTPGFDHNFSFTTEVHLKFVYNGGETFSFTGDDDLWIFIDGKLAIDLGGLHTPSSGSVSLDTLGLTKGKEYPLDLFNAERHSTGSNFQVDTDLSFTSCGSLPPDVPK